MVSYSLTMLLLLFHPIKSVFTQMEYFINRSDGLLMLNLGRESLKTDYFLP